MGLKLVGGWLVNARSRLYKYSLISIFFIDLIRFFIDLNDLDSWIVNGALYRKIFAIIKKYVYFDRVL